MNGFFSAATLALVGTSMATDLTYTRSNCAITGDPHFYPFGTTSQFENQQAGHFHYVYSKDGNLAIQGHQVACRTMLSCIEYVTVQYCGTRFKISRSVTRGVDPEWKEIHDTNQEDGVVSLPVGFAVEPTVRRLNGYRGSILSLPDGTRVQASFSSSWQKVLIDLPEAYNDNVKGMCGLNNGRPTLTRYGISGNAHYVNSDNNDVVPGMSIAEGIALPALDGFTGDVTQCPNRMYANDDTGDITIATVGAGSDAYEDTQDLTPSTHSPQAMATALENCQAVATAKLAEYGQCTMDDLNDLQNGDVAACQTDMVNTGVGTDELRTIIHDHCEAQALVTCQNAATAELNANAGYSSCTMPAHDDPAGPFPACQLSVLGSTNGQGTAELIAYIQNRCTVVDATTEPVTVQAGCHLRVY